MNFKFSPWSPELYEECMTKQRANFVRPFLDPCLIMNKLLTCIQSWFKAYEALAAYNQHHEVMVAFDPDTNAQTGWTLMCSPTAIVNDIYAFLPLMPSKEKTGLIAAVGVDESARGKGMGLALMVKAKENMRDRGVEGVCIDSVAIRGFYEKLGFETFWEYEGYVW
jgi:beta-N-acetylhexosaminidase